MVAAARVNNGRDMLVPGKSFAHFSHSAAEMRPGSGTRVRSVVIGCPQ